LLDPGKLSAAFEGEEDAYGAEKEGASKGSTHVGVMS